METTLNQPKVKRIEINNENPTVLLAAYGTLRDGYRNHQYLLMGKSKLLGTFKTDAVYTMWGKKASFPIVTRGGVTAIEYDLFEIKVKEVLERIHNLESFTGIPGHPKNWYDVDIIDTPFGQAIMYVQEEQDIAEHLEIVKSGNWKTNSL